MALTYQQTENVTLSRRDGEQLTRLHPSTTGAYVALTVQGGIENDSLLAELEAVRAKMGGLLTEVSAMQYRGVVHADGDLPTTYEPGWLWKVGTAGTYRGRACEAGDLIIANTSRAGSGNADADFDVMQGNAERPVSGPESAAADNVAVFGNAEGTRLDDGGVTVSELEEMIGASQREWIMYSAALPDVLPAELADGGLLVSKSMKTPENGGIVFEYPTYPAEEWTVPDNVNEILLLAIVGGVDGGPGGEAMSWRLPVTPGDTLSCMQRHQTNGGTGSECRIESGSYWLEPGRVTPQYWGGSEIIVNMEAGAGGAGSSTDNVYRTGGNGGGFAYKDGDWLKFALGEYPQVPENGGAAYYKTENVPPPGAWVNGQNAPHVYGDLGEGDIAYGYGGGRTHSETDSPRKAGGPGVIMIWWGPQIRPEAQA